MSSSAVKHSQYDVLFRLAEGGMAYVDVARAKDAQLVAIKRPKAHLLEDPAYRRAFMREAQLAELIQHENVVRVHESGVDQEGPYIVMDYVQGTTLRGLLRHGKRRGTELPQTVAAQLARDITQGVEAVHRCKERDEPLNIVHRDISPTNVLLSWDGEVKIADFGVARSDLRQETTANVIKGKLAYMAPELLRYERATAASDLFALGTVLHEVFTGWHPFDGLESSEIARRVLSGEVGEPADWANAPEGAETLVRALRDPRPERRAALEQVIEETERIASRATLRNPNGPTLRRHLRAELAKERTAQTEMLERTTSSPLGRRPTEAPTKRIDRTAPRVDETTRDPQHFVRVDTSHWPVLILHYPVNASVATGEAFERFEADVVAALERQEAPFHYFSLADMRKTDMPISASDRRRFATMLLRITERFGPPVAAAIVIRSKLMRLMISGVNFLIGSRRWPRRVCTTPSEARDFLQKHADGVGIQLPKQLLE
ncbi:MAG: serine/threonine-protein kinase [Myxococcota bacterium]